MGKTLIAHILILLQISMFSQPVASVEKMLQDGIEASNTGKTSEAIDLFSKCITLSKKQSQIEILTNAHLNLGNVFAQMGKSEIALTNYLSALEYATNTKNNLNQAVSLKNIGALYAEQKDFKLAMTYYEKAIEIGWTLKNPTLRADCLNNLGVIFEQQEQYKQALEVYLEALEIYKETDDQEKIGMTYNNLGIVYKYLKDFDKSIKFYQSSIDISTTLNHKFMMAANLNNLGNVYAMKGDHKKSLGLILMANSIAREINASEIIIESYDGIASAHENLQQYKQAIENRKLYEKELSNFINAERAMALTEMDIKYKTLKKEEAIKDLQQKGKIDNLEMETQKLKIIRKNRLIISFSLLLVAMITVAYFWKGKQKLRYQLAMIKTISETEEQERQRISKDIHDDLGSGLTKINFLSEMIFQKTSHLPDVNTNSLAVKETASKMIENMRDLIWALHPDETTVSSLVSRIREYTSDYFEEFGIEPSFVIPDSLPETPISKESHRGVFMVIKEILNNISKHSQATQVVLSVWIHEQSLNITIHDNGLGFQVDGKMDGNGLKNIKVRLNNLGATYQLTSEMKKGTFSSISIPTA